jgi:hypothetical protein
MQRLMHSEKFAKAAYDIQIWKKKLESQHGKNRWSNLNQKEKATAVADFF